MNKNTFYILLAVWIPFHLAAQNLQPARKGPYELRESHTNQFRSPHADLIKANGFDPYSRTLQSNGQVKEGNTPVKTKSPRFTTQELTARYVASAGQGYFFESFEDAYGSRLPAGWSNYPSAANANNTAFYWQAFSPRIPGNPDPQNRTVMSIEGLLSSNISFDEMIRSPEIEILPHSILSFNVGFKPVYLCEIDFDKGTFEPTVKNVDLEIRAKAGNDEESTVIFSLFEASKNDADFQTTGYRTYCADLSAYAGKKIYLEFRYSGKGVSRIDLDNISIHRTDKQEITLPALYQVCFSPVYTDADRYEWNFGQSGIPETQIKSPVVSFNPGTNTEVTLKVTKGSQVQSYSQELVTVDPLPAVSRYIHPDGVYLINSYEAEVSPDGYLAPTDVCFEMNNQSLFSDSYRWEFGSDRILADDETSESPGLISYLSSSDIPCPVLHASNVTSDSIFNHPGNLYLGGNYLIWNIENLIGEQNGRAMQGLGSNSAYQFEAISEHYSRPLKEQFVSGVLLHFIIAQNTSDFTLTATIRGIESGKELAKSVLPKSKASSDGSYGAFFLFNFPSLIRISEPFAIEIAGIPNGESDKLFMINQYFGINGGKPFEANTAYFKMKGAWIPANDLLGYATSLSISPFMISPVKDIYLKDESAGRYKPYNSNRLQLDNTHGTLDMGVISTFPILEKPITDADWIRCTSLSVENNLHYVGFTYDSRGDADRQATIHIKDSLGVSKEFIVYQGSYSGIITDRGGQTTISRNGNRFTLTHLLPGDRRITVYDICGRIIGNFDILPGSMSYEYSLPEFQGIHIIRITGENPRTFKQ